MNEIKVGRGRGKIISKPKARPFEKSAGHGKKIEAGQRKSAGNVGKGREHGIVKASFQVSSIIRRKEKRLYSDLSLKAVKLIQIVYYLREYAGYKGLKSGLNWNYTNEKVEKALLKIKELNLKSNEKELCLIPDYIGKLENLQKVLIAMPGLRWLPETFFGLSKIHSLSIIGTQIRQFSNKVNFANSLIVLNLSNNLIKALPAWLWSLVNLEELNLSGNPLVRLTNDISKLVNLQKLIVQNARLIGVPPMISYLKNLVELDLNGNFISILPATIQGCKSLKVLNLGNNVLGQLPQVISWMNEKQLNALELSGNNLPSWQLKLLNKDSSEE